MIFIILILLVVLSHILYTVKQCSVFDCYLNTIKENIKCFCRSILKGYVIQK